MMIQPNVLFDGLKSYGIGLFVGVPDSSLRSFCAYVDDQKERGEYIISANEGNAIAIAVGYHLATSRVAAVYMQNSGLGNAINPLTSLADREVYRIPMLLIIGWRGEPGLKDEPQHIKQGRITPGQFELLEMPYYILDSNSDIGEILKHVFNNIKECNAPVALLVKMNALVEYEQQSMPNNLSTMYREEVLRILLDRSNSEDLFVSTTGKTSREMFELRDQRGDTQRDFLTVGAMGHTSSIALGVALGKPTKRVVCLDGDGSLLMHMGALPIIGDQKPDNFVHVLLNNAAHESVGGQPTVADKVDFEAIALASGYTYYHLATDADTLHQAWSSIKHQEGPFFLEVKIRTGSRDDLGRPTNSPEQNKLAFMEAVNA